MFGVGVVEVAVGDPDVFGEAIAPYLGFFVPVGVVDVGFGEVDSAVVEFFEEAQVEEGVVESVVVDVDFGFSGPDFVSLYSYADSGDVVEADLTVEEVSESGPDFVVVDAKSAPQAMGQQ
ncbi:MAG: hypothetical protein I4N50_25605, partial [Rhizobium sp.]|nr:hypothetical protein [Rhizobium sp.]